MEEELEGVVAEAVGLETAVVGTEGDSGEM